MERRELVEFVAEKRVMHSFLPDDDDRSKNEYVADELIAAGFVNEPTGKIVGRAWTAMKLMPYFNSDGITVEQVRRILEVAFTDDPIAM